MARFVKHTPCPSCGSRDNRAEYDDGSSYCFGCGSSSRRTRLPQTNQESDEGEYVTLPKDATTDFPPHCYQWLTKDGLDLPTILKAGIKYSPSKDQALFPYYDRQGQLALVQARNFRKGAPKYFNIGNKEDVYPIYGNLDSKTLVLCEDTLSAIKIGMVSKGMSLLGTSISATKLAVLGRKHQKIVVWLDRDKWREAREIADKARWLGLSTTSVFTEQDPKTYSLDKIKELLS